LINCLLRVIDKIIKKDARVCIHVRCAEIEAVEQENSIKRR